MQVLPLGVVSVQLSPHRPVGLEQDRAARVEAAVEHELAQAVGDVAVRVPRVGVVAEVEGVADVPRVVVVEQHEPDDAVVVLLTARRVVRVQRDGTTCGSASAPDYRVVTGAAVQEVVAEALLKMMSS